MRKIEDDKNCDSSFFGELLKKLCAEYDKKTLAALFNSVFEEATDKNVDGEDVPFAEMDPFTFIAFVDTGTASERTGRCRALKAKLRLRSVIPADFGLIPAFQQFRWRFVPYAHNGGTVCSDKIWKFASGLASGNGINPTEFDDIIKINGIGTAKLSLMLYICFPDAYFPMDRKTCRFMNFEKEESFGSFNSFQRKAAAACRGVGREQFVSRIEAGTLQAPSAAVTEELKNDAIPKFPLNQILFGPSGTGKTYTAVLKAMEIIDGRKYCGVTRDKYRLLKKRFDDLRKAGRIEMVTFHSAYSYDDFVEGIKPNTENRDTLTYTKENGVFKSIVNIAKAEKITAEGAASLDFSRTRVFKMSLRNTANREDGDIYEYCMDNDVITTGYGEEVDFSCVVSRNDIKKIIENGAVFKEKRFTAKAVERFKIWMRTGDIVLISNGNDNVRAIAQITGDYYFNDESEINYCHFRPVKWLYRGGNIPVAKLLLNNKLPRQPIYAFCVPRKEGLPDYNENINSAYLKQLLGGALAGKPKNYVIIIDEINRGDISRIFGELTTLLDDDKRLGAENELTVKLPYTKEVFGIPKNLYIIGTMSSSDRAGSSVDITLRRRFSFIGLAPRPELVPEEIRDAFVLVNKRVNALIGGDFLIGHGYFMNPDKMPEEVWFTSIIPLVAEYCRGHWEKLQQILGLAQSETDKGPDGKYSAFIKQYTTDELSLKGAGGYCYGFAAAEECDFVAALENLKRGTRNGQI